MKTDKSKEMNKEMLENVNGGSGLAYESAETLAMARRVSAPVIEERSPDIIERIRKLEELKRIMPGYNPKNPSIFDDPRVPRRPNIRILADN